jgi:hypothetical protein
VVPSRRLETRLTWAIAKYPKTRWLSKQDVDEAFQEAASIWTGVTDKEFVQVEDSRPILNISFVGREDGEAYAKFDGPGGITAYASFPQYGGNLTMDDEENWTLNSFKVGDVRGRGGGFQLWESWEVLNLPLNLVHAIYQPMKMKYTENADY